MRPVFHSDVTAAARALLAVPPAARASLCAQLFEQADWADRYARKQGKPHPDWGSGTLLGASRAYALAQEPTFDDAGYCDAFQLVLAHLKSRAEKSDL